MACLNAATFCQEHQAQDAPKTPQDAEQTAQDAPKTPQDAPKTHARGPKTAPRCFQDASKTPQRRPKMPKDAPRRLKNAQECQRMPKNALKSRKIKKFHFELYQRIPTHGGAFEAVVGEGVNPSPEGRRVETRRVESRLLHPKPLKPRGLVGF